MPPRSLPENPSLEHLRKEAKRLKKSVDAGEAEALALVRELHPRGDALPRFSLADAQLVVARGYGFASWPKLRQHVEIIERFTWTKPRESHSPADEFLRLACVDYAGWRATNAAKAERRLADDPSLARTSLWTAAAAGDVGAAREILDRDPRLVNAKGAVHGWEPILYACYSRVRSTLDVVRLLLERGADPNAAFLWYGNIPPFTALTAAFGEGEDSVNQPPHPDRDALARLLLDAGADPNDGQVLYNKHFNRDDAHLRLLFEYGLGIDQHGPWYERLGDRLQSPARLLVEELWSASRRNHFDRVKLLVEHGADVNTPGLRDGRTPYEAAMRAGNLEIADYLVQHGATPATLDLRERFAAACIAGRREEVTALLREHPELPEQLGAHGRIELVQRAVEMKRPDAVRLLAGIGFEISATTKHDSVGVSLAATPLHNASGDLAMTKVLIELGADPNVRDRSYDATPFGWAVHGRHWDVAEYLLPRTKDVDVKAMIDWAVAEGDAELEAFLRRGTSAGCRR